MPLAISRSQISATRSGLWVNTSSTNRIRSASICSISRTIDAGDRGVQGRFTPQGLMAKLQNWQLYGQPRDPAILSILMPVLTPLLVR